MGKMGEMGGGGGMFQIGTHASGDEMPVKAIEDRVMGSVGGGSYRNLKCRRRVAHGHRNGWDTESWKKV